MVWLLLKLSYMLSKVKVKVKVFAIFNPGKTFSLKIRIPKFVFSRLKAPVEPTNVPFGIQKFAEAQN